MLLKCLWMQQMHHWGQQLSDVDLMLLPRSLRQQYFNFHKAQGDGVLIHPPRTADLKPTTLLLVEFGCGAVTCKLCKHLWNCLSWAEGEKKLGTSFSLPNLSEPWQLIVSFSSQIRFLSADQRQRDHLLQTATEENHTYLSPDVQANEVISDMGWYGCVWKSAYLTMAIWMINQGIGVPYFQADP